VAFTYLVRLRLVDGDDYNAFSVDSAEPDISTVKRRSLRLAQEAEKHEEKDEEVAHTRQGRFDKLCHHDQLPL
jgi:hypothetical protein